MMLRGEIYAEDLRAACAGHEDWLADKRVLVTGATGLIGSFLADALLLLNDERGMGIEISLAGRSRERVEGRFGGAAYIEPGRTGDASLAAECCVASAGFIIGQLTAAVQPVRTDCVSTQHRQAEERTAGNPDCAQQL